MSVWAVARPKTHVTVTEYCLVSPNEAILYAYHHAFSTVYQRPTMGGGGIPPEAFRRDGDIIYYMVPVSGYRPLPKMGHNIARIPAGVLPLGED